jgi:hypothetical protein
MPAAARWYIARNNTKVGPFTGGEIKQLATYGLLQPTEYVWAEGTPKWVEAATVPGLFPAPGEKKFWLSQAGRLRGPYTTDQIRAGLSTSQLDLCTQVCAEGSTQWQPLGQLTEFRGFVPAVVSPSRAQLLRGSLDLEEAALYLAGKSGDALARLITTLMDLKRKCSSPALAGSLDATIRALQARREETTAPAPAPPPAR